MSDKESKDAGTSPRLQLSTKKKFAFACIATFMGLLFVELLGRVCGFPSGYVRTLSRIAEMDAADFERIPGMWRPNFKGRIAWPKEAAYNISINKLGFRGPEISLEKAPGTYRIVALGDSTTFSVYTDEQGTYPFLLQQHLRKFSPKVEVVNAGHPAWGTHDEQRFLEERGLQLQPDCVIHLFCHNDPFDIGEDPEGSEGRYQQKARRIREGQPFLEKIRFDSAIGEIETRVHLAWKGLRNKRRTMYLEPARATAQQWKNYEVAYAKLVALCKAKNIALITACFPPMKEHSKNEDRFETKVGKICAKYDVPFIELSKAFRDAEKAGEKLYWFPIDGHANGRGNALLAEEIAKALARRKLGPYSK